jgi:hypothetical protein
MRSTVTIDSARLGELVSETKARSKAAAVNEAIAEFLRRKKVERLKSMRGKLEFAADFDALRHRER